MSYVPPAAAPELPPDEAPARRSRGLGCAFEIVETLVLTLLIYLVIHNFVAQPFEVEMNSMVPTIVEHEYVLIDKISPRLSDYRRGDIVVFQPPAEFSQGGVPFIKRVIGLPGDRVQLINGQVWVTPPEGSAVRLVEPYVNTTPTGEPEPTQCKAAPECKDDWTVPAGQYFVLGDNREVSQDSRVFGPINRDLIVGRAWLRYFPLDRVGFVGRPDGGYPGLPEVPGGSPEPSAAQARNGWRGAAPQLGSSATTQVSMARS